MTRPTAAYLASAFLALAASTGSGQPSRPIPEEMLLPGNVFESRAEGSDTPTGLRLALAEKRLDGTLRWVATAAAWPGVAYVYTSPSEQQRAARVYEMVEHNGRMVRAFVGYEEGVPQTPHLVLTQVDRCPFRPSDARPSPGGGRLEWARWADLTTTETPAMRLLHRSGNRRTPNRLQSQGRAVTFELALTKERASGLRASLSAARFLTRVSASRWRGEWSYRGEAPETVDVRVSRFAGTGDHVEVDVRVAGRASRFRGQANLDPPAVNGYPLRLRREGGEVRRRRGLTVGVVQIREKQARRGLNGEVGDLAMRLSDDGRTLYGISGDGDLVTLRQPGEEERPPGEAPPPRRGETLPTGGKRAQSLLKFGERYLASGSEAKRRLGIKKLTRVVAEHPNTREALVAQRLLNDHTQQETNR